MLAAASAATLLASAQMPGGRQQLAGQLRAGMRLVYEADATRQPPWTIDSVAVGSALMPGAQCAVVVLRRQPDQQPEERRLCLARDTLYSFDARSGGWSVSRPVGANMVWTTTLANGDIVRYETAAIRQESVSGLTIPVVLTTVTTTDSAGVPKRRLRERYAPTLTTATGGVFEIPDSSADSRWSARTTFELREVRMPNLP